MHGDTPAGACRLRGADAHSSTTCHLARRACRPAVKIVTGSLQGVLRVHQPHQAGCQIEDILLEAELGSSILQVAAGNFLQ